MAKYGTPDDTMALIKASTSVWLKSDWTARQVAAVTPLLSEGDRGWVYQRIVESGLLNALGVLAHLDELRKLQRLDIQIEPYLLDQPKPGRSYPLYKVLIARAVLQGRLSRTLKAQLRNALTTIASDRHYERMLKSGTRRSAPHPAAV
jgi:hypothetical protein